MRGTAPLTPVLDRLNHHGRVRALVFGNHGEAPPDVQHFITAAGAARKLASDTMTPPADGAQAPLLLETQKAFSVRPERVAGS